MAKKPVHASLVWTGSLSFRATLPDGRTLVTDGDSRRGFSPVELMAVAISGCMAADVVHILERARQPLDGLRADLTGLRAPSNPHRLVRVELRFVAKGGVEPAQLERAVQLSREKYCSVWNSLRSDTELEITTRIEADGIR
jgi:putative redox protein